MYGFGCENSCYSSYGFDRSSTYSCIVWVFVFVVVILCLLSLFYNYEYMGYNRRGEEGFRKCRKERDCCDVDRNTYSYSNQYLIRNSNDWFKTSDLQDQQFAW